MTHQPDTVTPYGLPSVAGAAASLASAAPSVPDPARSAALSSAAAGISSLAAEAASVAGEALSAAASGDTGALSAASYRLAAVAAGGGAVPSPYYSAWMCVRTIPPGDPARASAEASIAAARHGLSLVSDAVAILLSAVSAGGRMTAAASSEVRAAASA